MTKEEIAKLYHLPYIGLTKLGKNLKWLARIISIAFNMGIMIGRQQTHKYYNEMFQGYNEVSIKN